MKFILPALGPDFQPNSQPQTSTSPLEVTSNCTHPELIYHLPLALCGMGENLLRGMNKGTVEREPSKANEPAWIRATTQGNEALEGRTALMPFLRSKTF